LSRALSSLALAQSALVAVPAHFTNPRLFKTGISSSRCKGHFPANILVDQVSRPLAISQMLTNVKYLLEGVLS
jgi:hypothetical protein